MNVKKIVAILICVAVVFIAVYLLNGGKVSAPLDEGDLVACTADAMQCPNGTWVGRSGPNCEFVCPTE